MRIGSAKESYAADAALLDSRTQRVWAAIGVALLALFPFVADDYWLYLACLVAINTASALGLNLLTGYTGLVSLGQAAFMGLGAYTVAILQIRYGTPLLVNLLAGGVVGMLAGVLVGLPSLRVKGLYLAIATIAAGVIAHFLFTHFTALTGGTSGLSLPPGQFFGIALDSNFRLYWVIVPVTIALLVGCANLLRTKLLSFAISSFYAGVAGGLFAYFFRAITPESFPLTMSIFFLAAVIVGGLGTLLGSVLGAAFMTLVPEVLKLLVGVLPIANATLVLSPVRTIVFGALIVLFLIFEPLGLAEICKRVRRFFHLWPFRT